MVVLNDPVAFARWHLGELRWGDALRSGAIEVRALGRWPGPYPPGTEMLNEARNRSTASSPPVRHSSLRRRR